MRDPGRQFGQDFLTYKECIMPIASINNRIGTSVLPTTGAVSPAPTPPIAPSTLTSAQKDMKVIEAVQAINHAIRSMNTQVSFNTDTETGVSTVTVTDSVTKEVIRQMPSDEVIAVARALHKFEGLILNQKA